MLACFVPIAAFAQTADLSDQIASTEEIAKEVEQLVDTIDQEIEIDDNGQFVIDESKINALITDELVAQMNQFFEETDTEQAIYVTKESLTQDFKEGIDTINAEIENGNLERLENGTLVKADDDQFYVQAGSTYDRWCWFGLEMHRSKYQSTLLANEFFHASIGTSSVGKQVPTTIGKVIAYCSSGWFKGLYAWINYENGRGYYGTVTSLYWVPAYHVRQQGAYE